jgi:hypothetical protein
MGSLSAKNGSEKFSCLGTFNIATRVDWGKGVKKSTFFYVLIGLF